MSADVVLEISVYDGHYINVSKHENTTPVISSTSCKWILKNYDRHKGYIIHKKKNSILTACESEGNEYILKCFTQHTLDSMKNGTKEIIPLLFTIEDSRLVTTIEGVVYIVCIAKCTPTVLQIIPAIRIRPKRTASKSTSTTLDYITEFTITKSYDVKYTPIVKPPEPKLYIDFNNVASIAGPKNKYFITLIGKDSPNLQTTLCVYIITNQLDDIKLMDAKLLDYLLFTIMCIIPERLIPVDFISLTDKSITDYLLDNLKENKVLLQQIIANGST